MIIGQISMPKNDINWEVFEEEYWEFKEYFEIANDEGRYSDKALEKREELEEEYLSHMDDHEQKEKWLTYYTIYLNSK